MNVLVISAHPDDETLGCGGTLLDHKAHGDNLFWLIVTKAHAPSWNDEVIRAKEGEVEAVGKAYGMQDCFWLGLPSTQLDTLESNQIIGEIRVTLQEIKPQTVYVVHHGDIHTDHRAVFQSTTIVLKPFYMHKFGVQRLLSFECLSSTDAAPPFAGCAFIPNVYNDITKYLDRKIEIMSLYQTEVQSDPLPRGPAAIRALARYRGSTIGVDYAEAFMLIREVR